MKEIEIIKPTLKVDLDVKLPDIQPVEHNLDIIEEYAVKLNDFYTKLVFNNEQYKEATDERTKVNKLKKIIENNRKEIVKEYKKPIDDFESTSKRIEKLLENCADTISESIKTFDLEQEKIKSEKIMLKIESIRQSFIKDFEEYAKPLQEFVVEFNQRWFNKTYKDKDLEEDIVKQFNEKIDDLDKFKNDAKMICDFYNTIDTEHILNKDVYVERYKYTRNVNEVIESIKTDYEAKKSALQPQNTKEELIDPFAGLSINNEAKTKPRKVKIELSCLESQLDLIKTFAKQNNIEMGDVIYGE